MVLWSTDDVTLPPTETRVMAVFRQIEEDTCINFTARSNHTSYLLIRQGWRGCWASSLGYPGPNRKVTVQLGRGCVWPSIIQHEILHALGYPHEHSRPDRDNHITVKWENIQPGRGAQFVKNMRYPTVEEVPYDYSSVMHYGKRAFSRNRQPTLEPNVELDGRLGGRRMSELDKLKVNIFYECPTDSGVAV
ncbi:hypothetical protein Pcinc_007481 [Petrolisthes cinctipes]|uniref:Metalloendopeptidase n=1 Tax=Petrolisthes cinctipes TaxID=88211 RepID=A0AAE1GF58_PETCI|nr:hypothetical protein Pcinc_007481 [Petrolisthes cinctipes]